MSREMIFVARAEALALSSASAAEPLDRARADAAIRASIRCHGGVRGCLAALAQEFGEHPDTAPSRMKWARRTVAEVYADSRPGRRAATVHSLHARRLASVHTDLPPAACAAPARCHLSGTRPRAPIASASSPSR